MCNVNCNKIGVISTREFKKKKTGERKNNIFKKNSQKKIRERDPPNTIISLGNIDNYYL